MVDIFLDTSVFIEHILGNFSIEKLVNKDRLFSSINVLEETFYKSIILKTFEKFGKISKYTAKKKYIKNPALYNDIIMFFEEFIDSLVREGHLKILEVDHEIFTLSVKISKRYGLLPNDALIAATCKHHAIRKIATFDPDFKRVDFLEIITPEYFFFVLQVFFFREAFSSESVFDKTFLKSFKEKGFIYPQDKHFVMEKIPGWIERLLLPKLNEITGEIKAIHTCIDAVEKGVASLRNEMMTKFKAADVKVESLRKETKGAIESLEKVMISRFEAVDSRFDSLEARIPVMEKMAEFEVRLAEIEKKLSVQA